LTVGVTSGALGASALSCTHGGYDGSFDSAGLEVLVGLTDARGPPITKSVPTSAAATTTLDTVDGVFEIDVPPHAFPRDVTSTTTQLADRTTTARVEGRRCPGRSLPSRIAWR
jgi:hypothetical protein